MLLAAESIDGKGNNPLHPDWGSAGVDLLRKSGVGYADGVSSVAGTNRPSPRAISNVLSNQAGEDILSDRQLSAMIYAWGQFIDHDFDLTPTAGIEPLKIKVPMGDPSFDPRFTGTQTINSTRSLFNPLTGTSAANPRQQINTVTAFLDGSMIYGSSAATATALRTMQGGKLKTGAGNLLPDNDSRTLPSGPLPMANDAHLVPNNRLFAAGDVRANENIELTSLHTLFVREHNLWAGRFAAQNSARTDEQLYQLARARVIAELQSITYNEWLPALVGPQALPRYQGFNPQVNPGISTEFSTAAFRFGHSLLGDDIEFLNNRGLPIREEVSLSEAFFNPPLVRENGIDPILKYLSADPSSELDLKVVDSVRNFLFGPPGAGGLDLVSLNIIRGRDHGLPDYNSVRKAYGLPKVANFAQITSDRVLQAQLKSLYTTVDNVDLWVGLLAENHIPGGSVGATLRAILTDQFRRLRDGDRYWYQNQFSGQSLREIEQTTLSDVIARNTGLTSVQKDVFFFRAAVSGKLFADSNGDGRFSPREFGLAGRRVELLDALSGEVVAVTKTDVGGNFQFNVADGIRTGDYFVRFAGGGGVAGAVSQTVSITSGGQFHTADLAVSARSRPAPFASLPPSASRSSAVAQHSRGSHAGIDFLFAIEPDAALRRGYWSDSQFASLG